MRSLLLLLTIMIVTTTAQAQQAYDSVHYGNKVSEEGAVSLEALMQELGDPAKALPMQQKVSGEVTAVCQKKGCWMKMERPNGKAMRVTFKDYGFFVPKDLAGQEVVMKGKAYQDTVSVRVRRHFARDEGKSEAEVKQINEPTTRIAFKATGVKILQP